MVSLAQSIPVQVLEQIIEYASGVRRKTISCCHKDPQPLHRSAIFFLWVCHDWRSVAMKLIYHDVVGIFNSHSCNFNRNAYFLPCITTAVYVGAVPQVKVAHIPLNFLDITMGHAARRLQYGLPATTRFENVNELVINIESEWFSTVESVEADEDTNIRQFMAILSRMFPRVRYTGIYVYLKGSVDFQDKIADIIDMLSAGKQRLTIEEGSWSYSKPNLSTTGPLEHISLRIGRLEENHLELIRRNSRTLKCIHLIGIYPEDVQNVVCDSSGNLIEYPAVKRFEIGMASRSRELRIKPLSGNPFPELRHFICEYTYPFTTLGFLEGFSTLESIRMLVDVDVMKMFKASGLLGTNHFRYLRDVHLEPGYMLQTTGGNSDDDDDSQPLTLPQIALGLSNSIETVVVDTTCKISNDPEIIYTLEDHAHLTRIQVLAMPFTLLTFQQVIRVIGLFPLLKVFSASLAHEDPGNRKQLTANIVERQVNLARTRMCSSQLMLLRFSVLKNLSMPQLFERVFLLSVLAPLLIHVEVPLDLGSPKVSQSMTNVMKRKAFRAYADRLSRLVIKAVVLSQ